MNPTARLPALALAAWLLMAAYPLSAQGLPSYSSMNPMVQRRSGLATLPWIEPGKRWRVSWLTDYASIIEYADLPDVQYLQDAELMRLELTATRGIGSRGFLLASGSIQGDRGTPVSTMLRGGPPPTGTTLSRVPAPLES